MTGAIETRDEALDLLEERRAAWLAIARDAALLLYRRAGRPVTVDDIRVYCPPPAGCDPRVMGAVFLGWRPVGYVNSLRRTCHGRPIRLFEPADAEGGA